METAASSHHVQCSIELAEPVLFQKGFNLNCQSSADHEQEAILRAKLVLRIAKAVKLKVVRLEFTGRSRAERYRAGSLPETYSALEEKDFIKHSWFFFDARRSHPPQKAGGEDHGDAITLPGLVMGCGVYTPFRSLSMHPDSGSSDTDSNLDQHTTEQKYLPFQASYSWKRVAGKRPDCQLFEPGTYEFFIEFPIPRKCPETIRIRGRYVHYQLKAFVKLKTVLKAEIHKTRDVILVRMPDLDLVEQAGPILIDKTWEDRLHYNLAISSKSFPIGSKIPITLLLSSSKLRCHSLRVYLTENIQFFGHGENGYQRAPQRKIKLLENMAITPRDTNESGSKHGPKKIGLQVQLPSCLSMRESGPAQRIHPDTQWDNVNVSHWINVVLSLHKMEPDGPTEIKRQCYDISIDHPIHILSCYATSLNTLLPAYSSMHDGATARVFECGCPDAVSRGLPPEYVDVVGGDSNNALNCFSTR
ncbi:hypothetical protein V8E51_012648 [Hyaloscypha variabilis]